MLALPAEMLGHVMCFVSLTDVAHIASACAALRAAAAALELDPERAALNKMVRLYLDMGRNRYNPDPERAALDKMVPLYLDMKRISYDPDVLTLRGAVDACRRWGLSDERPFAAVLSRMARQLDAGTVPVRQRIALYADAAYLVRRAPADAFFETREAPVRQSCAAAVAADGGPLPVLMPGEAVRFWTQAYGEMVCPVELGAVCALTECVCQTSANDNRLVLCVPIGAFCYPRPRSCLTIYLDIEVPCDAADAAAIHPSADTEAAVRPHDNDGFARRCLRYAVHAQETWGAPRLSVLIHCESSGAQRRVQWQLTTAGWQAALRYYARAGVPVRSVWLHQTA